MSLVSTGRPSVAPVRQAGPMAAPTPEGYPAEWETTVVLADGSTASIRPIRPDDGARLAQFHGRQSAESIYFRYFRFRPELSASEIEHFTVVDYEWRMAFIALVGDEMVAVARYEGKQGQPTAEVAFFVDDRQQRKGLGTLLLEFLAAAARRSALEGLTATVLAENYRMLRVFRKAGFDVESKFVDGVIEVDLGIELTDSAAAAIEERARTSTVRSVARLLEPTSIALVGASRRMGSVGRALFDQIVGHGFAGPVIPVNPNASEIAGRPTVDRLTSLDEPVDLAIVAVPEHAVAGVIDDGVAAGIGGFVVVSSGPSELTDHGAAGDLIADARAKGVRLIGPSSFGVLNTDPDHAFHALFLPVEVSPGPVGVLSQSGPLGASLLERLAAADVGVSSFVAMGDRSDVSVNDVLEYWTADERTEVVILYLDDVGNPRNFARIARRLAAVKTVIMVGPRSGDLRSMLDQCGVIVVERVAELVSVAAVAVHQPPPAGGGGATVLSNSTSIGRLAAVAAARDGLPLVTPASLDDVDGAVADVVPGVVVLPVDRPLDELETAVAALSLAENVGAVVLAVTPSLQNAPGDVAAALDRIDEAVAKPMVATALVGEDRISASGLPVFRFPEDAVAALAPHHRVHRWRAGHASMDDVIELGASERELLDRRLATGAGGRVELRLGEPDLTSLLAGAGIESPATVVVDEADPVARSSRVVEVARSMGGPVALKAGGLTRLHPGNAGGVVLDLDGDDQVAIAAAELLDRHGDGARPLVVQAMTEPGHRVRIEIDVDPIGGTWLRCTPDGGQRHDLLLPTTEPELRRVLDALGTDSGLGALLRFCAALGADQRLVALRSDPVLVRDDGVGLIELVVDFSTIDRGPLAHVRHLAPAEISDE